MSIVTYKKHQELKLRLLECGLAKSSRFVHDFMMQQLVSCGRKPQVITNHLLKCLCLHARAYVDMIT